MEKSKLKTIILALILISGCSSKTAVRPPSEESLKVKGLIEIVSNLNKAYVTKDNKSFMLYISTSSSIHEDFKKRIKRDFDTYEKISLNLTPRWARVREDSYQLSVHWEGKWHDPAGKEIRDLGNGLFTFKEEEGFKIIRIGGDSPFGISGE